MAGDSDPLLDYTQMAKLAGVAPTTLRSYRRRIKYNPLPPPDDSTVPDRPRWRLSTFLGWMDRRPGPGARTDLTHRRQKDDASLGK